MSNYELSVESNRSTTTLFKRSEFRLVRNRPVFIMPSALLSEPIHRSNIQDRAVLIPTERLYVQSEQVGAVVLVSASGDRRFLLSIRRRYIRDTVFYRYRCAKPLGKHYCDSGRNRSRLVAGQVDDDRVLYREPDLRGGDGMHMQRRQKLRRDQDEPIRGCHKSYDFRNGGGSDNNSGPDLRLYETRPESSKGVPRVDGHLRKDSGGTPERPSRAIYYNNVSSSYSFFSGDYHQQVSDTKDLDIRLPSNGANDSNLK